MEKNVKSRIENMTHKVKDFVKDPDGLAIVTSACALIASLTCLHAAHNERIESEKENSGKPNTEQSSATQKEDIKAKNDSTSYAFYSLMKNKRER